MSSPTNQKGDLAELRILNYSVSKGYKVSIPFGQDTRYDLIVDRNNGTLERVQCKHTKITNNKMMINCCSASQHGGRYKYTKDDIDWIAAYCADNDCCYFIPSTLLGKGRNIISLRLAKPKNNQIKGVTWANDFKEW